MNVNVTFFPRSFKVNEVTCVRITDKLSCSGSFWSGSVSDASPADPGSDSEKSAGPAVSIQRLKTGVSTLFLCLILKMNQLSHTHTHSECIIQTFFDAAAGTSLDFDFCRKPCMCRLQRGGLKEFFRRFSPDAAGLSAGLCCDLCQEEEEEELLLVPLCSEVFNERSEVWSDSALLLIFIEDLKKDLLSFYCC